MDKGYHAAMRVPAKLAKICRTPADCPLEPAYAFAAGVDEGRAVATRPACLLSTINRDYRVTFSSGLVLPTGIKGLAL